MNAHGTGGGVKRNPGGKGESSRLIRIGGVLAVLPIDAFTGKTILTRDFTVEIKGVRPPVRKQDGYFVFSDVPTACAEKGMDSSGKGTVVAVWLRGRGYQETVLHVSTASVSPIDPVITVRMNPDASYPFPPHTVRMEGRLSVNCCLRAACLHREGSLRLAEDYHAGEETVALYRGGRSNLTGSLLYIEKEPAAMENNAACGCFLLLGEAERGGTGRYRLAEPLKDSFGRLEARLYPARMQTTKEREAHYFFAFHGEKAARRSADPDGKGTVPDGNGTKTGCDMLCLVETTEGIKEHRLFVENGEMRVMDF